MPFGAREVLYYNDRFDLLFHGATCSVLWKVGPAQNTAISFDFPGHDFMLTS